MTGGRSSLAIPRRWVPGGGIPAGRQRGFTLIVVLWSLALLAVAATFVVQSGRSAMQSASALRDHAAAMAAADGGIQLAMFRLLQVPDDPAALRLAAMVGPVRV